MRFAREIALGAAVVTSAACGGGSRGTAAAAVARFVAPSPNSAKTSSVTDIDFISTSTNSIVQTITGVNADGSFSFTDTIAPGTTVSGTHFRPSASTADADGHVLSVTYNPGTSNAVTCTYSPHGPGPDFPLIVGATWQLTYTRTCGTQAPVTYMQTGSVVDTETVTVPAGTFASVKLQSTIQWPIGPGSVTEAVTRWVDAASGHPIRTDAQLTWAGVIVTTTDLKEEDTVLTGQ
jgi:hypothetical protein